VYEGGGEESFSRSKFEILFIYLHNFKVWNQTEVLIIERDFKAPLFQTVSFRIRTEGLGEFFEIIQTLLGEFSKTNQTVLRVFFNKQNCYKNSPWRKKCLSNQTVLEFFLTILDSAERV
jgi:hypothetical protein